DARKAAEKQTEAEKKRADEAGRRVHAVQAHLALEKGWTRLDRGEVSAGLLWMVRGLEEAPADEGELKPSLRRLLGAWPRALAIPRPVALLPLWERVSSVVFAP